MSEVLALLADLHARGAILSASGDRLVVDAPVGRLTEQDKEVLRQHKAEMK